MANATKWKCWNDLTLSHSKSYCLKAVLDLHIPDILDEAGGQLSLAEIASKLPSKTVNKGFLSRILTFAALCGVFDLPSEETENAEGNQESHVDARVFALNPLSMMLLERRSPNPDRNPSHFLHFQTSTIAVASFEKLGEAALTGTDAFTLSNGASLFDVVKANPTVAQSFHKAMGGATTAAMGLVLEEYDGFKGIKVLVDVGGGLGASMTDVNRKYPDIQCVNFDLPHVIAKAPEIPGVKHVGGDMFQSVPQGDAIFMKWVLHDWSDEDCVRILRNCLKALPENHGRVLIVETVLPPASVGAPEDYVFDMLMLAHTAHGRERTESQWRQLLSVAGFHSVQLIPAAHLFVIEGYK